MTPMERLQQAWVQAGYPPEYMPKQQFEKAAPHVASAYDEGAADFIREGWQRAGVDFPFSPSHPRYQALIEAYGSLGE